MELSSLLDIVSTMLLVCGVLLLPVGFLRMLVGAVRSTERWVQIKAGLGLMATGLFLAIAGIIFQPRMPRPRAQSQLTACKSNLKNIGTALEMYSEDHKAQYPARLDALTPNYLKTLPHCPAARSDTYSASYSTKDLKEKKEPYYSVACQGENHKRAGVAPNYPAYNPENGLVEAPR